MQVIVDDVATVIDGKVMHPTKIGLSVAEAAEEVICTFRNLQSVVALNEGSEKARRPFKVVATSFAWQTFGSLVREYSAYIGAGNEVEPEIDNSFNIAERCGELENDTLYLLDLPIDLSPVSDCLPQELLQDGLFENCLFRPFAVSHFVLKCSDRNPYASKSEVRWADLEADQLACHDDPFLMKIIGSKISACPNENFGMKVSNTILLNAAIHQSNMLSVSASLPELIGEIDGRKISTGIVIEPIPRVSFVTGALGTVENCHKEQFSLFVERYLSQAYPAYVEQNNIEKFVSQ